MKKQLLILLVTISFSVKAQPHLWSTMQIGGSMGTGIMFHINGNGTGFSAAPNFPGGGPQCNLLPYNGFLYGINNAGGISYEGEIFKYNVATGTNTPLFSFSDTATGKYPAGSLFLASNGKMYGTTMNGGSADYGTFFSFDPANNQLTKLVEFVGLNGQYPVEDVIEYNGKLYGTTGAGGVNSFGEIFSYELSTGNFNVVHSFNFTDGMAPYGSLLVWNSLLYGTTFVGGINGAGSIFSFDPLNPGSVTTLHNFNTTDGSAPMGSLIYAGNSLMYGTTAQGGVNDDGTLFSFNTSGNVHTKLHDFNTTNGKDPESALMQASDGNLYGTTVVGGSGNIGTVFKYDIGSAQFTKIYDCNVTTGGLPRAAFLEYNATIGLHDLSRNNSLKIIGNPIWEELQFELKGYEGVFSVQVFSTEGKIVSSSNNVVIHDAGSIDVSGIAEGSYLLYMTTGNHEFIAPFIKN